MPKRTYIETKSYFWCSPLHLLFFEIFKPTFTFVHLFVLNANIIKKKQKKRCKFSMLKRKEDSNLKRKPNMNKKRKQINILS